MKLLSFALVLLWATPAASAEPLPEPYQQALRDLRTNRDGVARAWAAVGLGQGLRTAPSPGKHPKIIEGLEESARLDPDPTVQAMAAYALCLLRDARGVPPLIDALKRHAATGRDAREYFDDRVRIPVSYLYRAFGVVGGKDARDFLVASANEGERGARVVAISTLGGAWPEDGEIDALLGRLLSERDPAVKGAAMWAIEERQRKRAAPAR